MYMFLLIFKLIFQNVFRGESSEPVTDIIFMHKRNLLLENHFLHVLLLIKNLGCRCQLNMRKLWLQ